MTTNPFEFGRELGLDELVDRETELREIHDALTGAAKLFLIGPRRFGKTSLLAGGAELARRKSKALVLRYNLDAFPSFQQLATRIVRDVAASTAGTAERIATAVQRFFKSLKPEISYQPADGTWSVSMGVAAPEAPIPLLVEALQGLERAARSRNQPTAIILDEFQGAVERGGVNAEAELRAVVQEHRHVGYLFAGSATRLLAQMTTDPGRPFYRLGQTRYLGPIPREAFREHLKRGLRPVLTVTAEGVEAILNQAADVPYNVQLLGSACWEAGRNRSGIRLTPDVVAAVAADAARRNDPVYTHLWTSLTAPQRRALVAVVREGGAALTATATARRYGVPVSTMQKSLSALLDRQLVREDLTQGKSRLVLEDPLFATWLRTTIEWT